MRAKKSFLIASFLCTWSLISYFLLIRQTDTGQNARHPSIHSKDNRRKRDDFVKQMNDLETNIYKENELHDHLVKLLVEIVQLKNVNNGQQSQGAAAANALANQNLINDTPIKNNNGVDKNVIFGYENNNIADTAEGKVEAEAKAEVGADGDAEPFNKQAKLDARLRQLNSRNGDNLKGPIIPVLVFACNRISVRNCLDDLVRYRPNNSASVQQFPIIVSQVKIQKKKITIFFSLRFDCNNLSVSTFCVHFTWNVRKKEIRHLLVVVCVLLKLTVACVVYLFVLDSVPS